jgi:hypothetical protein
VWLFVRNRMLGFFDVIEGGDEHKICGVRALKLSFNCSSAIAHLSDPGI